MEVQYTSIEIPRLELEGKQFRQLRTENGIEPQLLHLERVLKRGDDGHVIRRSLDLRFYDAENFQISEAGIEYFRPIFGDLPESFQYPDLNIQYI